MRFELHCHSHYSKGRKIPWEAFMSPRQIIKTARDRGVFGVAITDHDSSKSWKEGRRAARDYGTLFIPGIEISTLSGHLIGLGLNEHVPEKMGLEETIDLIRGQGGIVVAPHPFDLKGEGIVKKIGQADAVEVFNSLNLDRISNRLAFAKAEEIGKPMVVGSDSHTSDMLCSSVNEMNAYTLDEALGEIKAGRVDFETSYVPLSVAIDWSRERFSRSYMDVLRYINRKYSPPRAWIAKGLLRRFVFSKNRAWDQGWRMLGQFGIGCSMIYGSIKYVVHY
jgi:predicted metal-dependent phosphoesterase TrpH